MSKPDPSVSVTGFSDIFGLRLSPFQYRSEVEITGSFDIADAGCRPHRRANSADAGGL